jgi:hypothetical protein
LDSLKLGRLDLPLVHTPTETVLDIYESSPLAPMAWVLNNAMRGSPSDFRSRVEGDQTASEAGLSASRVRAPDPCSNRRWRAWTGLLPTDDMFALATSFIALSVPITRAALLRLFDELMAWQRAPRPVDSADAPAPADAAPADAASEEADEDDDDAWMETPGFKLHQMEARALVLDERDVQVVSAADAAAVADLRRAFLDDLLRLGLLEDVASSPVAAAVDPCAHPTVLGYREAAREILAYQCCEARLRDLPNAQPFPVVGGPVSLGWFRLGAPTPGGVDPLRFLVLGEHLLRWQVEDGVLTAACGDFFYRDRDPYRFTWRKDDGIHPALVVGDIAAPARRASFTPDR